MKHKLKFEFSVTGLILAVVLVGMFAFSFGYLATDLTNEYSLAGNNTLAEYNNYQTIKALSNDIQENATNIKQNTGLLDIIGGFFASGYSALKITYQSFDLYEKIIDQASEDVPEFAVFKDYLNLFLLIGLFVGLGIAVLLKWKV